MWPGNEKKPEKSKKKGRKGRSVMDEPPKKAKEVMGRLGIGGKRVIVYSEPKTNTWGSGI